MKAVDLFAGAGGFSTGATMAGISVVWAANHWPAAVNCHAANHPNVQHACQDLQQADWGSVPAHDVLLASPSCQGHAKARGKERPHHDAARSTAWAVVSCAEVHRPEFAVVENVPEFRRWLLYPAWTQAMSALGYSVAEHVINAADHGVPQSRVRLFVVCSRSKTPLRLTFKPKAHVPAGSFITAPAITPVSSLCPRSQARIANGRAVHGSRFLMAYFGTEKGGRSLNAPLGTVTTRDRYALVDGDRCRMLAVDEYRQAMGFPDYQLPANKKLAKHLLGNAVCPPVARDILEALR